MNIRRLFRHLFMPPWLMRRTFSAAVLQRIGDAVRESERRHRGELRVVIEAALEPWPLMRGQSPRQRARAVFARYGVWDTAENSGVLLYVNWADRDIEIVADRGIDMCVTPEAWEQICRRIEAQFRAGRYEDGLREGIADITALLECHFPATADRNPDELDNRPLVL